MKRKINSLDDMKTEGDLFTACTEALESRDTSILDLLLDNKHPDWEFPKEDREGDNMTPMHKHLWRIHMTILEMSLLQISVDDAEQNMNPTPSCISEADINIVQTLLASMQLVKHDGDGDITGFEHWDIYHKALAAFKRHEFGSDEIKPPSTESSQTE